MSFFACAICLFCSWAYISVWINVMVDVDVQRIRCLNRRPKSVTLSRIQSCFVIYCETAITSVHVYQCKALDWLAINKKSRRYLGDHLNFGRDQLRVFVVSRADNSFRLSVTVLVLLLSFTQPEIRMLKRKLDSKPLIKTQKISLQTLIV